MSSPSYSPMPGQKKVSTPIAALIIAVILAVFGYLWVREAKKAPVAQPEQTAVKKAKP